MCKGDWLRSLQVRVAGHNRSFVLLRLVAENEYELLELLASTPGKTYSREELLETIWGSDYPGDERTVDVHIRRLREKLEINPSEPKYVRTKWGAGYYFQA